jgi:hypothetical protein
MLHPASVDSFHLYEMPEVRRDWHFNVKPSSSRLIGDVSLQRPSNSPFNCGLRNHFGNREKCQTHAADETSDADAPMRRDAPRGTDRCITGSLPQDKANMN